MLILILTTWCLAASDVWFTRLAPAMNANERKLYRSLTSEAERVSFREAFWAGKGITEAEYLTRAAYADSMFGSGQKGSGANTDQGRIYLANGAPNAIHKVPSSRIFVACEVWYYDSLPRTGYRGRLQFLFYKKNSAGDFRLFSPQLDTIRALLIPQPTTRSMFPVNDEITPNDVRNRLKYSPAEEELMEAATGVARGVTGSENGTILARAASPSHMLAHDAQDLRPAVESRFMAAGSPEVRLIQFWTGDTPVTDVQIRAIAATQIAVAIQQQGSKIEQSSIPLGLAQPRSVVLTQRFFLLPGKYTLSLDADGRRNTVSFEVSADRTRGLTGEAFAERPEDLKLAMLPDPRGEIARDALSRQASRQR